MSRALLPRVLANIDRHLSHATSRVNKVFAVTGGIAIMVMTIQTVVNAIGRWAFASPLPGTVEMSAYWWMPMLVFLGAPLAERTKRQIEVRLLLDMAQGRLGGSVSVAVEVASLLAFSLFAYYGVASAVAALEVREGSFGASAVAVWPFKILASVGLIWLVVQSLHNLIRAIRNGAPLRSEQNRPPLEVG